MFASIKEKIKIQSLASLIIGSLVLIFCILFVWNLIAWFFSIEKTVLASIIAGIFAIFSLIFTYWKEKQKSIKESHREKKIEIYSIFFEIMFEIMQQTKNNQSEDEGALKSVSERWLELTRGVLFYGSPKVIKSIADFKVETAEKVEPTKVIRSTGNIMLAMREDIGLSNNGLDELSIHQVYINDDIRKLEFLQ